MFSPLRSYQGTVRIRKSTVNTTVKMNTAYINITYRNQSLNTFRVTPTAMAVASLVPGIRWCRCLLTSLRFLLDLVSYCFSRSWDNSVGVAMGCVIDGRVSIRGEGKIFLFSITSRPALGSTQPLVQWVPGAVSLGVKRPSREAGHLPTSSAEVKKSRAIPPLPHTSS
jgi:hypothetical protein